MRPDEARKISEKVDKFDHAFKQILRNIKWAAEAGLNEEELSYTNCPEIRKRLKDMGYIVKWSWKHMDHIAIW